VGLTFGGEVLRRSTLPTDRQFQGHQNQPSIGLDHMGVCWYDLAIGVWTQPDSVVPNPHAHKNGDADANQHAGFGTLTRLSLYDDATIPAIRHSAVDGDDGNTEYSIGNWAARRVGVASGRAGS
jgi:RHS repeat-associated protein